MRFGGEKEVFRFIILVMIFTILRGGLTMGYGGTIEGLRSTNIGFSGSGIGVGALTSI